jgi:hypothetical protein
MLLENLPIPALPNFKKAKILVLYIHCTAYSRKIDTLGPMMEYISELSRSLGNSFGICNGGKDILIHP